MSLSSIKALTNMRLIPLLLCLSFMIPACTPKQQTATDDLDLKPIAVKKRHANLSELQPQFLFLAAQNAIDDGQPTLAIEFLSALIKKDPQAIKPRLQLIELLLQSRQAAQSKPHITVLLQGTDLNTEQREYLELALLRLYAAEGQNDTALAGLELFLQAHPTHLDARNLQIKLLASLKRYDDALTALETAINIKEQPELRLLQAQIYIKKRDFSSATTALKRMQKLAPRLDTPVLMLSAIAMQNKQLDTAESLLRNFLSAHPNAFRITNALGQLLVKDRRPVEAILMYRHAVELSKNNPVLLHALGMLYFRRQAYSQAEPIFRQLLNVKPDDSSRFYLAASLEALNRTVEARNIYKTLGSNSILATEAQLRLTAIDVVSNNIDQAEQRLQDILKKEPMQLDALLMLSTIRLNQQKFQLLLDETKAVFALPRPPAQILFNRAIAFESLKQYDQVEAMLTRLLRFNPNHAEAMNFLAYTYAIQSINLGKAEALVHRALILKPDNGYYLDSLAWIYYKKGDYAKAISTQSIALEKTPDDAIMHEHYGDMLWKNGDQQAARKAWKKAIALNSEDVKKIKAKINNGLTSLE